LAQETYGTGGEVEGSENPASERAQYLNVYVFFSMPCAVWEGGNHGAGAREAFGMGVRKEGNAGKSPSAMATRPRLPYPTLNLRPWERKECFAESRLGERPEDGTNRRKK